MTNLNYDNAAALINAFMQGAKFKVSNGRTVQPVTKIEANTSAYGHGIRVHTSTTGAGYCYFRPDGTNSVEANVRLIRDESLGFDRTSVTVGDSVFGWTGKRGEGARAAEPAPATPVPLLQRLLKGETFHVPKTRETLVSFEFQQGKLLVTLKGEDGKTRVSERYTHEGKHKWHEPRSLVAGPVPPKAPVVPEYTAEQLLSGGVEEGVYQLTTGDKIYVAVLGPKGYRTAVFLGWIYPCAVDANESRKFVKTNEKASAILARLGR